MKWILKNQSLSVPNNEIINVIADQKINSNEANQKPAHQTPAEKRQTPQKSAEIAQTVSFNP